MRIVTEMEKDTGSGHKGSFRTKGKDGGGQGGGAGSDSRITK